MKCCDPVAFLVSMIKILIETNGRIVYECSQLRGTLLRWTVPPLILPHCMPESFGAGSIATGMTSAGSVTYN